jgi:acyl-ACP thioesterase
MKNLRESFIVKSYETDINGNLKLFSFMNMVQELAGHHADILGFGYDNLISSGVAWVLSRMHIKFFRIPRWKEKIEIETWHKGGDRLFWYRDFVVTDSDGVQIMLITSSWAVIDIHTRRLGRAEKTGSSYEGLNIKDAISERAEKIIVPENMMFTRSRMVSFSDLDINGHTNNAKYIEWALDTLPYDMAAGRTPVDMVVNFNQESRLGEKIDFHTAISGGSAIVEGRRDGTSIFIAKLMF